MRNPESVYYQLSIDFKEIPQSVLNIDNKKRSNPLTWNGQFSPQLIQAFLETYSTRDSKVLDPFLGSGTVLLECANISLPATGVEVNPAAVLLSRLYEFTNIPRSTRQKVIHDINQKLEDLVLQPLPLFDAGSSSDDIQSPDLLKTKLGEFAKTFDDPIRKRLLDALVIISDYHKVGFSGTRVMSSWKKITNLVQSLPFSDAPIVVHHSDARSIPIDFASINLVITSPPYINVYNYHQQYRASAEVLDWNLLQVAKSEIGSNRKHRGNRFLTVAQYCLDIAMVFNELARVCEPNSRAIFVVGKESNVRRVPFYNGALLTQVAYECTGFTPMLRQQRMFQNRFGQKIYEDILHFQVPSRRIDQSSLEIARDIAAKALSEALPFAEKEVIKDIEAALSKIEDVRPSELYKSSAETT